MDGLDETPPEEPGVERDDPEDEQDESKEGAAGLTDEVYEVVFSRKQKYGALPSKEELDGFVPQNDEEDGDQDPPDDPPGPGGGWIDGPRFPRSP